MVKTLEALFFCQRISYIKENGVQFSLTGYCYEVKMLFSSRDVSYEREKG